MEMKPLGRTGIMVSDLCLGTMTFGTQTTEADGHRQIEMALEAGVNFLDAAEMYPVNPISKETVGRTEEILGNWNAANPSRRGDYVLATKHSGAGFAHVRDGAPISAQTIPQAVEGSLKRLQTEYIDLYQFHWPNRGSYMFRQNWDYAPSGDNTKDVLDNMQACLEALQPRRWTRATSARSACRMKAPGALRNGLGWRKKPAARAWRRFRTSIRCCAAFMIRTWPS